jgi:hypothetical protein
MLRRTSKFSIRNVQRRPRKLARLVARVQQKVQTGAKLFSREAKAWERLRPKTAAEELSV